MSAKRGAPRSLFRRPTGRTVSPSDEGAFTAAFRRVWRDPAQELENALRQIERAGDRAAADAGIERGPHYAEEIRTQAALVRELCKQGETETAVMRIRRTNPRLPQQLPYPRLDASRRAWGAASPCCADTLPVLRAEPLP